MAEQIAAEARDRSFMQAVQAWRAGRFAEAEAVCRGLLAGAPEFAPAVLLLGMLAARTGRTPLAIRLLRQAIGRDPGSVEGRTELAMLLRQQGDTAEAADLCEAALRLAPAHPGAHHALGLCRLGQNRLGDAAAAFARAASLDPEAAMAHFNLGLIKQMQGGDIAAARHYRDARRLSPAHAETAARLGQVLLALGEPAAAAPHFERAAVLVSCPLPSLRFAAKVGDQQATENKAQVTNGTEAALKVASILAEAGQEARAEAIVAGVLASDGRIAAAHVALGRLMQQRGRFADASASFSRAIELRPDFPEAFLGLVGGRTITDTDRKLIARMENTLRRRGARDWSAPDGAPLHYALGKAYGDLGDLARAMRHYAAANRIRLAALACCGRMFDRQRHADAVTQIMSRFTAGLFTASRERELTDEVPVLIRSGTTLVEQILSNHKDVGAGGELRFWGERARLALTDGNTDLFTRLAKNYCALLHGVAPGATRVTDKMPTNFFVLGLVHLALPNARIIHCRRDPLDTCLSIYTTPFDVVLDFAHDPETIMFYYEQYSRLMAHWRAVLPADRFLEVHYEELVAEPERVTREMVAFCGLTWDEACLYPERNERIVSTPSRWQTRQPIYRSSIGRGQRCGPWLGAFAKLLPPSSRSGAAEAMRPQIS